MLNDPFIDSVQILDVERVIRECHVGLEGIRKDSCPSIISHKSDLSLAELVSQPVHHTRRKGGKQDHALERANT